MVNSTPGTQATLDLPLSAEEAYLHVVEEEEKKTSDNLVCTSRY